MKLILLFIIYISITMPIHSELLSGEVEYNYTQINDISDFLTDKNYVENYKCINGKTTEYKNRVVVKFSDNTYGIKYFSNPLYSWYYSQDGKLLSYTIRNKEGFPAEVKKYKQSGDIITYGYQLSENESYWYKPNGKMIAHWIGKNCYDNDGEIIMTRSTQN